MLSNLSQALANVALELSIRVRNKSSQVWNGTLVNNSLGQFLSVLSNLRESRRGNALESEFGLLDTEDE